MATMPYSGRPLALQEVVPRILPQCDELHIYLNDYLSVPEFLKNPKIKIYLSKKHLGDMGDIGKFYGCDSWKKGYHFTVDDKILYPANYTSEMISVIEKYHRKAVVSAHGRIFHNRPSKSYYWDCLVFRGCTMGFPLDAFVHVLGTGAMAFHSSTLPKFDLSLFERINMTDIYFSIFLQQNKIPILNPKRPNAWIWVSNKHDDNYSIHNTWNKKDAIMTELINTVEWNINTVSL